MLFQNQYLSTITRHLHNMVETSLDKLNDSTDLSMFESSYALKDLNDDLENQTTMVTTLADIFANSGNSKYRYYIFQWRFWNPSLSEQDVSTIFGHPYFPQPLGLQFCVKRRLNDK